MPVNPEATVTEALESVQRELAAEFEGIFSRQTVDEFVLESAALFQRPEIARYLPDLIRRYARDLLSALARSSGIVSKSHPEVLFVCVQNAARSQMAAALFQHHGGGRAHARCAGTNPALDVHDGVRTVMRELEISLDQAFPKPLHRNLVEAADVIVTLGCGDACPILPGRRYEDWALPDPSDFTLKMLRELRTEIENRVLDLLERLRSPHP